VARFWFIGVGVAATAVIPLAAGLALFGERLRTSQLLGVALVLAGLVLLGLPREQRPVIRYLSADPAGQAD
jgi:multidrug transporter EmrE-like cation transporter